MSKIITPLAGCQSALANPCTVSSATQCHGCSESVANRMPQHTDAAANRPSAIWIRRRQSKRSARLPKNTEKNRWGSQWLITAKPASNGEWNACHMTQ